MSEYIRLAIEKWIAFLNKTKLAYLPVATSWTATHFLLEIRERERERKSQC